MYVSMLALGLLLSPAALAQEAPEEAPSSSLSEEDLARATTLFENGRTLYEEARYREAISAWEECYKLTNRAQLLFNLANAHERLAEYDEAIEVLNKYRAFAEADEKGSLERRINNLDRLAREKREAAEAAEAANTGPEVPAETGSGTSGKTVAGVALMGVGAAAIVTGVVFGLSATSAGNNALDFCTEPVGDGKPLCSAEAQPFLDQNKSRALLSDVSFGVGVASAAVGAILVVTGKGKSVSVGANSIRVSGQF
jgi:tetratricopeptide (TPR) repeat protein